DWAYAVVRNYFYVQAKKVKMDSLKQSTYRPLAEVAVKINMELYYHLLHWKTWFVQLLSTTEEAKQRMLQAIDKVMNDFGDVFSQGAHVQQIIQFGLMEEKSVLEDKWVAALSPVMESLGLEIPRKARSQIQDGRNGEHTEELHDALSTLAEVYNLDPAATW
ncbi:MAG: 1,2-phenylacetyl-CoA epoxidase subunit PaaC, partial [Neobacillus sp.]